jgi:hypothetical protein
MKWDGTVNVTVENGPSAARRVQGRRVLAADFARPWYAERARELGLGTNMHRRHWEWVVEVQAFVDHLGLLSQSVVGFGVGHEPIAAWFAARGVNVLATDRPESTDAWKTQHPGSGYAGGLADIPRAGICDEDLFAAYARHRGVDMNDIPMDLHGQFDFSWSTSSMEHLGGIEQGLRFFCEQMKCLRPGGVAAHSTEFNFLSDYLTLESDDLVVFRQRDLVRLRDMLAEQGDILWPVDLLGGRSEADLFVDEHPYQHDGLDAEPHLSIKLGGHSFTSVLLVASRGR